MESTVFFNNKKLFSITEDCSVLDLILGIHKQTGLKADEYYLTQNGKIINDDDFSTGIDIHAYLRIHGGKGGFGSMLRAIGAQIEKTTNREACRDLSGRRLRDINEEKRLKAWLEKQKDKDAEAEEKRRRKLEKLMAIPKHEFKDSEYEAARSELTEKVSEAVEEGFKKAILKPKEVIGCKRKTIDSDSQKNKKKKKAALWIDDGLDEDTSTDSDSDSDSEGESSKSTNEGKICEKDTTDSLPNSNDSSDGESSKSSLKTSKDGAVSGCHTESTNESYPEK